MTRAQSIILSIGLMYLLRSGAAIWAANPANPLEQYVQQPDSSFAWKQIAQKPVASGTVFHLEMISQSWRGHRWSHHLQVLRPETVRNPRSAFLYITGDGDGAADLPMLSTLARRAGALVAVVTQVPNQPLYEGRTEDALVAYTVDQYLRTGDETWPLLFPMVNSAVRAMDTIQAFARKEFGQPIEGFVVSGASKRGWTAWLIAAVDSRVKGVAPMVIDMLNMKAQLRWTQRVYGRQSERIHDYTELQLHEKLDDPRMQRLRSWIDPYEYRDRYTMPKLLLLGTNDPYWTVDALQHYWPGLPNPKLVYQTPNAGHNLGGGQQAIETLATWFQMIADNEALPQLEWEFITDDSAATLRIKSDRAAQQIRLWTAESADRDFRDERWTSQKVDLLAGGKEATVTIQQPATGYRAFLLEIEVESASGKPYRLSTEARVIPQVAD